MGTFIVALGSSRGSISDPALAWLLPTRGSVCSGANVSGVAVIIAKMLTRLNPSAEPLRQEFFWTAACVQSAVAHILLMNAAFVLIGRIRSASAVVDGPCWCCRHGCCCCCFCHFCGSCCCCCCCCSRYAWSCSVRSWVLAQARRSAPPSEMSSPALAVSGVRFHRVIVTCGSALRRSLVTSPLSLTPTSGRAAPPSGEQEFALLLDITCHFCGL